MHDITKGERELIDVLAGYDGIPASEIEKDERAPEATGFYKAVRAMVDAGLRSAFNDNAVEGKLETEGAAKGRDIAEAISKHSDYTLEYLNEIAADEGAEGKAGQLAAMADGYKKACDAAAAAGFKPAWVDDRRQAVGNSHGWIARDDI